MPIDWKDELADLMTDGIGVAARFLWRKLTGETTDPPPEVIDAFTQRMLAAIAEIKAQADLLGLQVDLINMVDGARGVLDAFVPKGEFPNLLDGVSVTIVPPDQTLDDVIAEPEVPTRNVPDDK